MGAADTPTLMADKAEPLAIELVKPEDHEDAPVITEFMRSVCQDRYLLKNDDEVLETVPEMFWRVATTVAVVEEENQQGHAEDFYYMMRDLLFVPGGRTLAAAGTKIGNLSNCFVVSPEDSLESILETQKEAATIWSKGGGVGFDFSALREQGANTTKAQGIASGPVSFLQSYNATADTIRQGGTRRAACMGELSIHHPDIESFIVAKEKEGDLSCFNVSVSVTDEFMQALKSGGKYNRYTHKGEIASTVSAQDTWDMLCKFSWQTADPGIFFIDTANRCDFSELGAIKATNPCGEQPLLNYESCNLGSLRIDRFVPMYAWEREGSGWAMPKGPTDQVATMLWDDPLCFNKEELRRVIVAAVRFLDNVISINKFPLPQIQEITTTNRKIGLGIMGWGDALLKLGIDYRSEMARALGEKLMKYIYDISVAASEALVDEGRSSLQERYPDISWSESSNIKPRRNTWTTSIAPTGSISMVAGCCSWSIEPIFTWQQQRKLQTLDAEGKPYDTMVVIPNNVYQAFREEFGEDAELPSYFVRAHDVTPEQHIRMMAAFQKHCHSAVSKTINLPHEATVQQVNEVFRIAYDLGCKGVTAYRDRCREEQVYYTEEAMADKQVKVQEEYERPIEIRGKTVKMRTNLGSAYITVNNDPDTNESVEVFIRIGKQGSEVAAAAEAVGKLISFGLQSGIPVANIVDHLEGITSTPVWSNGTQVKSLWDAVARVLNNDYNGHSRELLQQQAEDTEGAEEPTAEEQHVRCKDCGE